MKDENLKVVVSELIEILREYVNKKVIIKPDTRIFHDLMIYGDDAWGFLMEVSKRYNIIEPVFDITLYFPGEEPMFNFFVWIRPSLTHKWKPLTITDLAAFVLEGRNKQRASIEVDGDHPESE